MTINKIPVLAGQGLPRGEVGPAADSEGVLLDVDHLVVAHVLRTREPVLVQVLVSFSFAAATHTKVRE